MGKGARVKRCAECGVPIRITKRNVWLNNGTVVQRRNPSHRMIFIETVAIEGVFASIEKMVGTSIERIITESERRTAYDYVDHLVPGPVKKAMRAISIAPLGRSIAEQGRLMGLGDVEVISIRSKGDEGDYVKISVKDPFFLPAFNGMVAGSMEALIGRECGVSYQEVSPGHYMIVSSVSNVPVELRERLRGREQVSKEGDLELERCRSCGGPQAMSGFEWRTGAGVIMDRDKGIRMGLGGPAEFEAIFDELEKELGEDIPRMVVEAQSKLIKDFYHAEDARDMSALRDRLALQGLGLLREYDLEQDRLRMRVENPSLHLLLAGLALGLFELATGRGGGVDWRLAEDGDLVVEVSPR